MFNIAALKASNVAARGGGNTGTEIILCESLIDVLTFWYASYKNVTSSYGAEGFIDEHLTAFKQHHIALLLIAYDRDAVGDSAAITLSKKLIKASIDCYLINFPKGMDASSYIVSYERRVKI